MHDELARLADRGLDAFAEALFAATPGLATWGGRAPRDDWPARREALLRGAAIDACDRHLEPKPRCVIEELLVQLGATQTPDAIARLAHVAEHHPQRELRIRALHGLLHAGPAGVAAAAGPVGAPPEDADSVARQLRARAALLRGDAPSSAAVGGPERRAALLGALGAELGRPGASPGAPSLALLAPDGPWLAFVIDAYFDRALAPAAEAVLVRLPEVSWRPLVAARKRDAPKPAPPPKPSPAERRALDEELRAIRGQLEHVVSALAADGFVFVASAPLADPPKRFATKLRALEKRVGRVPLALARFWALVGAVDLRGNNPGWPKKTYVERGDDPHWYADPLAVTSLEAALADALDSDFDVAKAPAARRYALDLAGDDVTKANFSGGVVSVETPSDAIDPALRGREGTFLVMLREAIAWDGLPGFARVDDPPPAFRDRRRRR